MAKQLVGKIYWVNDEFNYNSTKLEVFEHTSAMVENFIFDENMIQFIIPNGFGYLDHPYNIKLVRKDVGNSYTNYNGEIECELFSNESKHILYGNWFEEGSKYTWWMTIGY